MWKLRRRKDTGIIEDESGYDAASSRAILLDRKKVTQLRVLARNFRTGQFYAWM